MGRCLIHGLLSNQRSHSRAVGHPRYGEVSGPRSPAGHSGVLTYLKIPTSKSLRGAGVAGLAQGFVDTIDAVNDVDWVDRSVAIPVAVLYRAVRDLHTGILVAVNVNYQEDHIHRINRSVAI
jgi:hypothetical protein